MRRLIWIGHYGTRSEMGRKLRNRIPCAMGTHKKKPNWINAKLYAALLGL